MKLKEIRQDNDAIKKVYRLYIKKKTSDKIDGLTFEKRVENHYKRLKETKKTNSYYSYLKKRYKQLIDLPKSIYSFVLYITILIPTFILDKGKIKGISQQFPFLNEKPIVVSYIIAVLLMTILCIIFSLLLYWIIFVLPFSKKRIEMMNIEINIITGFWGLKSSNLADRIDRKEAFKRTIIETIVPIVLAAVIFGWVNYII